MSNCSFPGCMTIGRCSALDHDCLKTPNAAPPPAREDDVCQACADKPASIDLDETQARALAATFRNSLRDTPKREREPAPPPLASLGDEEREMQEYFAGSEWEIAQRGAFILGRDSGLRTSRAEMLTEEKGDPSWEKCKAFRLSQEKLIAERDRTDAAQSLEIVRLSQNCDQLKKECDEWEGSCSRQFSEITRLLDALTLSEQILSKIEHKDAFILFRAADRELVREALKAIREALGAGHREGLETSKDSG